METTEFYSALEKMRHVVAWADNHAEYFNDEVKNFQDWEKLYDYVNDPENECPELIDELGYEEPDEYKKHKRNINKLLGYKLIY